jgi:hypothetical protein
MAAKYYVVINQDYYPSSGMSDWEGPYDDEDEAKAVATAADIDESSNVYLMKVEDNIITDIGYC